MADKNIYKFFFQFKNGKSLEFTIESDTDVRKAFVAEMGGSHVRVGEYIVDLKEILWLRIEGNNEEHSGEL